MQQELWKKIEELYHSASTLEESQRAGFLQRACTGNESLQRELQLLLGHELTAEHFLESSALTVGPALWSFLLTNYAPSQGEPLDAPQPASPVGTSLGRYHLLAKLGAGGMGIVYLANDEILDRKVAIKLIQPELLRAEAAKARFLREAQAVASLSHPNIAVLYEAGEFDGQPYLAMEYVAGRTLREELSLGLVPKQRWVEYAVALAAALEHAHRHGILHRDIKPSNVILPAEGRLKLLDFGLARFEKSESDMAGDSQVSETSWMGTLPYVPPEVLSGKPADARSDIYSLGVVLYEMASNQLPFADDGGSDLMDAILRGEIVPLHERNSAITAALMRIVERAMAHHMEDRFSTTTELLTALRQATSQSSLEIGSAPQSLETIAVLPFQNVAADPTIDWFATHLVETLTAELKGVKTLRVESPERVRLALRQTSSSYSEIDLVDQGRRLGARWLVIGSYCRAADRVRITHRLFDVAAGEIVTSGTVDGNWEQMFEAEDQLVGELIGALEVKLEASAKRPILSQESGDLQAFEEYAEGRKKLRELGKTSLEAARLHFERALSLHPQYAMAHSGLGATYAMRFIHRADPDDLVRAQGHLERSCELDPELADPLPWLCYVYMRHGRLEEAVRVGQRAIALLPDLVHAHYFLGTAYFARCESCPGEYQSTVNNMLNATRVDPRWQASWFALGRVALLNGNYDRAQEFAERLLALSAEDTSGTRFVGAETILGTVSLRRGNLAQAESWFQRGMETLSGSDHMYRDGMRAANACGLGDTKMHRGNPSEALVDYRRAWHIVQEYPRMLTRERASLRALAGMASAYAARGETQQARKLLSQAIEGVDRCADGKLTNPIATLPDLYFWLVVLHTHLGDYQQALDMLEKSFDAGWRDAECLKRDPEINPLSGDPRFADILRAIQESPRVRFELDAIAR